MKTVIQLIAQERKEQIEKHKRTVKKDVKHNDNNQLIHAADALITKEHTLYHEDDMCGIPDGWDSEIWTKMFNKSYKKRLVIAGALIAAEIDRVQYLESHKY